jgi:hypothetical protein
MTAVLVDAGADVKLRFPNDGDTPLERARLNRNVGMVDS